MQNQRATCLSGQEEINLIGLTKNEKTKNKGRKKRKKN
jgi:hypothetical protein